jgi:hypothetical protein
MENIVETESFSRFLERHVMMEIILPEIFVMQFAFKKLPPDLEHLHLHHHRAGEVEVEGSFPVLFL